MSWKAVELQVALPRTQDAGQLQDQLQQRAQIMQDVLSQEQLRELERRRKAVLEANEAVRASNEDDEESQNDGQQEQGQGQQSKQQAPKQSIPHPYLGGRVDFSG
ncbi:maltoporin [Alkalibacillus flavidus]|uniref:Maltoporin n=1 Tax=Alkalibacillus flavidus TaxID=546021 RepID=A0ABV2KRF1_9BACI